MDRVINALTPDVATEVQSHVADVLCKFSPTMLYRVVEANAIVQPLKKAEPCTEVSAALRRFGIDVAAWPALPAASSWFKSGRRNLRGRSPMTIAHEFGHAVDCTLAVAQSTVVAEL